MDGTQGLSHSLDVITRFSYSIEIPTRGSFTNYVDKILDFFDPLPTYVDIFYGMNVDKKWTF